MATIAEMNQAYTTRLQELEAEVKSLKEECDDLTEREAEARNEAEFLRGENDRIKDELDDYIQLTIDCCESGNPDHDDLLGYINGLQQKNKELTEEVDKQKDDLKFSRLCQRLIEHRFGYKGNDPYERDHVDDFIDYHLNECGYPMTEEEKERLYEEFIESDDEDEEDDE